MGRAHETGLPVPDVIACAKDNSWSTPSPAQKVLPALDDHLNRDRLINADRRARHRDEAGDTRVRVPWRTQLTYASQPDQSCRASIQFFDNEFAHPSPPAVPRQDDVSVSSRRRSPYRGTIVQGNFLSVGLARRNHKRIKLGINHEQSSPRVP